MRENNLRCWLSSDRRCTDQCVAFADKVTDPCKLVKAMVEGSLALRQLVRHTEGPPQGSQLPPGVPR